jgi:polyisoprenoid-binding protein YceI
MLARHAYEGGGPRKYMKQLMLVAVLGLSLIFLSACSSDRTSGQLSDDQSVAPVASQTEVPVTPDTSVVPATIATIATSSAAQTMTTTSTVSATSSPAQILKDGSYKVDTANSQLAWAASKIIGDPQSGLVNIKSGQLTVKKGKLSGGSFVIDMTTISNDHKIDMLTKHLSSDDFFAVATYPEAKLVITSVQASQTAGDYLVKANLTIKAVTAPVTFSAHVTNQGGVLQATAAFEINRTTWNVRYGSGKFFQNLGDKAVKDEIKFQINLQAKQ